MDYFPWMYIFPSLSLLPRMSPYPVLPSHFSLFDMHISNHTNYKYLPVWSINFLPDVIQFPRGDPCESPLSFALSVHVDTQPNLTTLSLSENSLDFCFSLKPVTCSHVSAPTMTCGWPCPLSLDYHYIRLCWDSLQSLPPPLPREEFLKGR